MKILYLDCSQGSTCNLLLSALVGLLPDGNVFLLDQMARINIPHINFSVSSVIKCGVPGTNVTVMRNCENTHGIPESFVGCQWTVKELRNFIDSLTISDKLRKNAQNICMQIAGVESEIHSIPIQRLRISKTKTMCMLAEIIAVCKLMEQLHPDETVVSPINVGLEKDKTNSERLPAFLSATAHILYDIPIGKEMVPADLQSLAGASLLRFFADRFGNMPMMDIKAEGYGIGNKKYIQLNCVRAMLGEKMMP